MKRNALHPTPTASDVPVHCGVGERLSCITLGALLKRVDPRGNDLVLGPKPTFVDLVKERADTLRGVLGALGQSVEQVDAMQFRPGAVLEVLDALIAQKQREHEKILEQQQSEAARGTQICDTPQLTAKPCLAFIRGDCPLDPQQCALSHTPEAVSQWCNEYLTTVLALRTLAQHGATHPSGSISHIEEAATDLDEEREDNAALSVNEIPEAGNVSIGVGSVVPPAKRVSVGRVGSIAPTDRAEKPDGTIRLSDPLGKDAFRVLLALLDDLYFLRELHVHALNKEACKLLCRALSSSQLSGVISLDLSGIGIGSDHPTTLARLASALESNPILTKLDLSSNGINTKGFLTILRTFDRGGGAAVLKTLLCCRNNICLEDTPPAPAANTATTPAPDSERNRIAHVVRLLGKSTLQHLNLASNPLGSCGKVMSSVLSENNSLTRLDLFCCGLQDADVSALCDSLRVNCTLQTLGLGWNNVTPEGAAQLFTVLGEARAVSSVHTLDLSCNRLGKTALRLGDWLKQAPTITSLDLRWTGVTEETLASLLEGLAAGAAITQVNLAHLDVDKKIIERIKDKLRKKIAQISLPKTA